MIFTKRGLREALKRTKEHEERLKLRNTDQRMLIEDLNAQLAKRDEVIKALRTEAEQHRDIIRRERGNSSILRRRLMSVAALAADFTDITEAD